MKDTSEAAQGDFWGANLPATLMHVRNKFIRTGKLRSSYGIDNMMLLII